MMTKAHHSLHQFSSVVQGTLKVISGDAVGCGDDAFVEASLIVCEWPRKQAVVQAAEDFLLCLPTCSGLAPHKQEQLLFDGLAGELMMDRLQFLLQVAAPCLEVAPEVCSVASSLWLLYCHRPSVMAYRPSDRVYVERLGCLPTNLMIRGQVSCRHCSCPRILGFLLNFRI